MLSPYTQTPPTPTPTPVSGGLFAANQVWSEFNGGSLVYGTIVSGSADLASSPIDGQNSLDKFRDRGSLDPHHER